MSAKPDITLFYCPKTRAVPVRWMLEELGVPYALHRVDVYKKEPRSAAHLAVHPLGSVPAIVDHRRADLTMFESAAILIYLAETYNKLQPAVGTLDRAAYLQWIVFVIATVEEPLHRMFVNGPANPSIPAEKKNAHALEEGKTRVKEVTRVLEKALEGKEYLVGNQFTAADVIVGGVLSWAHMIGALEGHAPLQAYVARLQARPAWKRANAD